MTVMIRHVDGKEARRLAQEALGGNFPYIKAVFFIQTGRIDQRTGKPEMAPERDWVFSSILSD